MNGIKYAVHKKLSCRREIASRAVHVVWNSACIKTLVTKTDQVVLQTCTHCLLVSYIDNIDIECHWTDIQGRLTTLSVNSFSDVVIYVTVFTAWSTACNSVCGMRLNWLCLDCPSVTFAISKTSAEYSNSQRSANNFIDCILGNMS